MSNHAKYRTTLFASSLLVAAIGLASPAHCAEAIRIGAVSTITGAFTFPESTAAAKAVFDRINQAGGIEGRKIEYLIEDDKGDPGVAAQAAHRLVDDKSVVVNVASASLPECSANAAYYKSKNFLSVQGTGVDPVCFTSSNISPVNTGPYLGLAISLYFASEILHKADVCSFSSGIPIQAVGWQRAIDRYTRVTGKSLKVDDRTMQPTDDVTPLVLKAKRSGCEAVVFTGIEPQVVAWMQAVKEQGVTGITWIFLTPAYTTNVAKVLGADGEGIYANSEFEPFLTSSETLKDWRQLMTSNNIPLTSFSEGGYLAATIIADVMKNIKGEVTRESVTAALLALDRYKTPLMGSSYSFGRDSAHNPNSSSKFVQIKDGAWVVATPDFVTLPN
ncbi:ABC transporter substrate-binding protein [Methylocapsa sp. S129]|uniref:ABC transporter substrate-binding protein n=1 Tax=Methylocapsa sp. S129 TaxID=1641869 RepID=UPI00131CD217|nr:ABC transporter substrate-binding protein [Methylocapsa sp. S129]